MQSRTLKDYDKLKTQIIPLMSTLRNMQERTARKPTGELKRNTKKYH